MRAVLATLSVLTLACGGASSPTSPTPAPTTTASPPSRPVVSGTITDTVTGARIGDFRQEVDRLPVRLPVSAAGYVTREAWITSASPTVDLFPQAGFDLAFYRQFARDELRGAGTEPLRVWSRSPVVIQMRPGVSAATGTALEAVARQTIPLLTGHRLSLQTWTVGDAPSADAIAIEWVSEPDGTACGRAELGGRRIWLNTAARCRWRGLDVYVPLLTHELGHVLGFSHVTRQDTVMNGEHIREAGPSTIEQHHAALAYARTPGNRDIDSDPAPGQRIEAPQIVVD